MIDYQSFILDNGLGVYVHEDHSTPIAAVNVLYNVGSRDEDPQRTGFAHLFEHLMFGGSQNVPAYDEPLQKVGGENNAFTSSDITNYYVTLPAVNLETAFWLESDRMLGLSFDPKVLAVQQKVVTEEFNQRYLNQPYGDVWLKLRPLAYRVHPYQWATIGKNIAHIADATLDDVRAFFYRYYVPSNATLVVAGDVTLEQVRRLSEKWFGGIAAGKPYARSLPAEPPQTESRHLEVMADVPLDGLFKAYHMPARHAEGYAAADLLGDLLGRSKSSRLYEQLVKARPLFTNLSAFALGSDEPGLLVVQGNLTKGISLQDGDAAVEAVVEHLRQTPVAERELDKVKNQAESTRVLSEMELLNRAINLAHAASLGHPELVNQESEKLQAVTPDDLAAAAQRILRPANCATLYYRARS